MKEVLLIDCCIRGEASRTKRISDAFLAALPAQYRVTRCKLDTLGLQPLVGEFFESRQRLLEERNLSHPRFDLARQFAAADEVVIAAPFWDLSFPALLKIYIENISVDGITFGCNENGCYGLCRGRHLVFLTTRGGFYGGSAMEQGSRYISALQAFFGFDRYDCVAAEGLDAEGIKTDEVLQAACQKAAALAAEF